MYTISIDNFYTSILVIELSIDYDITNANSMYDMIRLPFPEGSFENHFHLTHGIPRWRKKGQMQWRVPRTSSSGRWNYDDFQN